MTDPVTLRINIPGPLECLGVRLRLGGPIPERVLVALLLEPGQVLPVWVTAAAVCVTKPARFCVGATEHNLASDVDIQVRRENGRYQAIETDQRWSLLNQLWHNSTVPLDIRGSERHAAVTLLSPASAT